MLGAYAAVPAQFGYVIFAFIASVFTVMYLGVNVGRGRKKYGVKYPAMYSDKENMFNCIQRAHQNTLEGYPTFLVLLFIGGLQYPTLCAASGFLWCASRIVYAHGYYTGDPSNRNRGAFGYIGLLTMLACNISIALQLLGFL